MTEHIFLSYAPNDSDFAQLLRSHLQDEGFPIWHDDDPLAENDQPLRQAIQMCQVIIILATPHYFQCQRCIEISKRALHLNKPLLPVVLHPLDLPPTLRRRQPISFAGDFEIAIVDLCKRITWLHSSRGKIQVLRDRLADMERQLAHKEPSQTIHTIREQADMLRREIATREQILAPRMDGPIPHRPGPSVQHSPSQKPPGPNISFGQRREEWNDAPDIQTFYGRMNELDILQRWIVSDHCRVLALLGMGGIGKTVLATKLAYDCREDFTHVLWLSFRNAPPLDDVIGTCIVFLSDQRITDLPSDVYERIALLMNYLRQQQCLLVFDNVETILQGGRRAGSYREGYEPFGQLVERAGESHHQSLLLLTSREKPREFARLEGTTSPVRTWQLAGVSCDEGKELLRDKGLSGSDESWNALVARYSGNPLALKLTAESIREIFAGDIVEFLTAGETMLGDISEVLEQQFCRLSELEQDILYWLAIEREPVPSDALHHSMVMVNQKRAFLEALGNLRRRSLIEQGAAGFTLQNVVMEYVTEHLIEQVCDEIRHGNLRLLHTHALMKAQAKEYVRRSQMRLILNEVLERLAYELGGRDAVAARLVQLVAQLGERL